jgi:hypothetical protein
VPADDLPRLITITTAAAPSFHSKITPSWSVAMIDDQLPVDE